DYGRPPPRRDPAEALLWVPRVIFFPVHLVLEYVVRHPVGWVLKQIELTGIDQTMEPPGDQEPGPWRWWFRPSARYDHGFAPSLGLALLARSQPEGARLGVGVEAWGLNRLRGWAFARGRTGRHEVRLSLRGGYRADGLFHGLGWDAQRDPPIRYTRARGEAELTGTTRVWRQSALSAGLRLAVERFDASDFGPRPEAQNEAALVDVPGFAGIAPLSLFTRAIFDTRTEAEQRHGSGARLDLEGGWGVDLERGPSASWARGAASSLLALELRRDRTLALRGRVALAEPLGDAPVPFTERIWLGGAFGRMSGFRRGHLIGASAATLGLRYRYAVWPWLDAELFGDVGNVFGRGFEDFHVERLRLSFGFALRGDQARDFSLRVAFGTAPFVNGTSIDSVRFALGIATLP
ncbi:MAG TPA: hypothetical protein RMH99_26380, partial [Sandaracinaceae bacterium LLY-WYZ-13_1]|nr:hypothetical protein [Sandaracinaceae bacterium LLY-WYZ-13_1]